MRHVFDLSGGSIRRLQFFPDAVAAFAVPTQPESVLSMLVWGVVCPEPQRDEDLCRRLSLTVQRALPTALYLSGWGELTFHGVQAGSVEVWPYEPTFQLHHLKLAQQGNSCLSPLSHYWTSPAQEKGVDYVFSMILEQPLGFMSLKVVAAGPVTLSVDPHDFITEEELEDDPGRYRFDLTRTRQLARLVSLEGTRSAAE
jgi:hypothetical protein